MTVNRILARLSEMAAAICGSCGIIIRNMSGKRFSSGA